MALIPGYVLFEWLGLSGSLGALIMGLILAPRPGADQLAHSLFTVKELLLVGFFVSIRVSGPAHAPRISPSAYSSCFCCPCRRSHTGGCWLLGLRNRTSVLSAMLLSNYSEFALIVAALGVQAGWLAPHWLLALVIAVSGGFLVSAVVNPRSVSLASRLAQRLPTRPPDKIHPDDRPIKLGDARALILGMGRVGCAAYTQLGAAHDYQVLGVEHDPSRVRHLQQAGLHVVEGDATDTDFWTRIQRTGKVEIIVLAMPSQHANVEALHELRRVGYEKPVVAAVALYREDAKNSNHWASTLSSTCIRAPVNPSPTGRQPPGIRSHQRDRSTRSR